MTDNTSIEAETTKCVCRKCGGQFDNPYTVGESYLCDPCLAQPLELKKGVFARAQDGRI